MDPKFDKLAKLLEAESMCPVRYPFIPLWRHTAIRVRAILAKTPIIELNGSDAFIDSACEFYLGGN